MRTARVCLILEYGRTAKRYVEVPLVRPPSSDSGSNLNDQLGPQRLIGALLSGCGLSMLGLRCYRHFTESLLCVPTSLYPYMLVVMSLCQAGDGDLCSLVEPESIKC